MLSFQILQFLHSLGARGNPEEHTLREHFPDCLATNVLLGKIQQLFQALTKLVN